jgi:hypothetical protein
MTLVLAPQQDPRGTAAAFADALRLVLRGSRERQGLTRMATSARTDGLISASSVAAYEGGQRSIKFDVLVVLCRALGESVRSVVAEAEQRIGRPARRRANQPDQDELEVDVPALLASTCTELAPLRRWARVAIPHADVIRLGPAELTELARILRLGRAECVVALWPVLTHRARHTLA